MHGYKIYVGWTCVALSYSYSILLVLNLYSLTKKGAVDFGFVGLLFILMQIFTLAIFLFVKQTWIQIYMYSCSVILFIFIIVKYDLIRGMFLT